MSPEILLCMGTRPEIIKMAPVYHALREQGANPVVVHSGQHKEMAWPLYEFFDMKPEVAIDLQRDRPTLGHLSSRLLDSFDRVISEVNPAAMLVHGDTSSAVMAATAGYYSRTPVGHVEAGLRSGDLENPFPEEQNRVLIARLATWHFAPTENAQTNLMDEGVNQDAIHVVGNTVVDASYYGIAVAESLYQQDDHVQTCPVQPFLAQHADKRVVLVTGHRRENLGEPLENVARSVRGLLESHPDMAVIWPVHINPAVQETVRGILGNCAPEVAERLLLADPLSYTEMLWVMKHAWLTITDSGGIQEESAAFGLPVLITRKTTERPEIVAAGSGRLVGTCPVHIQDTVQRLWREEDLYTRMATVSNPYGNGTAGRRIASFLNKTLTTHHTGSTRKAA